MLITTFAAEGVGAHLSSLIVIFYKYFLGVTALTNTPLYYCLIEFVKPK